MFEQRQRLENYDVGELVTRRPSYGIWEIVVTVDVSGVLARGRVCDALGEANATAVAPRSY
ncbi:hypothetical protein [Natrinema caseinilyticum]|uniref:hypothetical protein n=1 Tax=Natrinema caseinilyticum TaxID=2961570 RepID=UPI0020C335FF|nr:hypothetical protein [Natrinema caseinilyticum]